MKTSISS